MIWRLAFEKKPIQFLREIIIQALVIFKLYSCSHSSFATHKLYPELGKACETSLYICWRHRFNVLCWTIVCNANICFNCQRNANYISLFAKSYAILIRILVKILPKYLQIPVGNLKLKCTTYWNFFQKS